MYASLWASKPTGVVKAKVCFADRGEIRMMSSAFPAHPRGVCDDPWLARIGQAHQERTCWDPKDGDLCPARTKPGETLVEVRSDSDVQIDRLSRV